MSADIGSGGTKKTWKLDGEATYVAGVLCAGATGEGKQTAAVALPAE